MKLTIKGQVTIPKKYRQRYGLAPHTEVVFEKVANEIKHAKCLVVTLQDEGLQADGQIPVLPLWKFLLTELGAELAQLGRMGLGEAFFEDPWSIQPA